MTVTLTTGGYTFTFQEGDINKVSSSYSTNIEPMTISKTGPLGTFIYDYEGVAKQITVTGGLTPATATRIAGYSILTILQQKKWIESVCNGNQSNIAFSSNYEAQSVDVSSTSNAPYLSTFAPTTCKIISYNFGEEEATPDHLPFTIVFEVGQ